MRARVHSADVCERTTALIGGAVLIGVALLCAACTSTQSSSRSSTGAATSAAPAAGDSAASSALTRVAGPSSATRPARTSSASTSSVPGPDPTSTRRPRAVAGPSTSGSSPSSAPATAASSGLTALVSSAPHPRQISARLTQTATLGGGVTAAVSSVRRVKTSAHQPGEIGGRGVRIALTVHNTANRSVDVGSAVVNVTDSSGIRAVSIQGPPTVALRGSIPPGSSKHGVYVFTLPQASATRLRVEFSYAASAPVVTFTGSVN